MNNKNIIILLLSLFISIIAGMQIVRMGIFNNANSFENNTEIVNINNTSDKISLKIPSSYLIVYDDKDIETVSVMENYKNFLKLYKKSADCITKEQLSDSVYGYKSVIIALTDLEGFYNFNLLMSYADNGGNVIFTMPIKNNGAYKTAFSVFGISELSEVQKSKFIVDKLGTFGTVGMSYEYADEVNILRLRPDCNIYFETESKVPLFWSVKTGNGFLYIPNGTLLKEPSGRGIVSQVLYESEKQMLVYPFFNIVTLHTEAFPGPAIYGKYKVLQTSNKNYERFIKDIFWPEILSLQKKYGIKITAATVQSFGDNLNPPYKNGNLQYNILSTYGTEVLSKGGELAFHGYFYRPLGLNGELEKQGGFIAWKSVDNIVDSFKENRLFINDCFPHYTMRTYFPPEGRIGNEVHKNIKSVVKDIRNICLPYKKEFMDSLTGDFYIGDNDLNYFAITSEADNIKWNGMNSLYSLGIISQSLNVYDIITDNNLKWKDICGQLNNLFRFTKQTFSDIQCTNVSDASELIRKYHNMSYSYRQTDNKAIFHVEGYFGGMKLIVRNKGDLESSENCKYTKIMNEMYMIEPTQSEFSLIWRK